MKCRMCGTDCNSQSYHADILDALEEASADMVNAGSVLFYEGCEVTRKRLAHRVAIIRDLLHRSYIASEQRGIAAVQAGAERLLKAVEDAQ